MRIFIKELETYVFATNAWKLKQVCEQLSYTIYKLYDVKENVIMRIDIDSGKVLNESTFETNNVYKYSSFNNYGYTAPQKQTHKKQSVLSTLDKNDGWHKTKDGTWRKTNPYNND
jgi:hypothetical protein